MKQLTDRELDYEVAGVLQFHRGKLNPIPRWELVRRIFGEEAVEPQTDDNIYDRQIRESVQRQRPALLICDMGDGRGRYLATSFAEYIEFHARYMKPALPVLNTGRAMMETAKQRFPTEFAEYQRNKLQPALFDLNVEA